MPQSLLARHRGGMQQHFIDLLLLMLMLPRFVYGPFAYSQGREYNDFDVPRSGRRMQHGGRHSIARETGRAGQEVESAAVWSGLRPSAVMKSFIKDGRPSLRVAPFKRLPWSICSRASRHVVHSLSCPSSHYVAGWHRSTAAQRPLPNWLLWSCLRRLHRLLVKVQYIRDS